jgi:hypothetical protein
VSELFKDEYNLDPKYINLNLYFALIKSDYVEHFFNGGSGGGIYSYIESYTKKHEISNHGYQPSHTDIRVYMCKIHKKYLINSYPFNRDSEEFL